MKFPVSLIFALIWLSPTIVFSQNTERSPKAKAGTEQVKKTDKKKADKVIPGKKGPDGQAVYQGPEGGQYYFSKSGNKVYLDNKDKLLPKKKGPNGEKVYQGPKGGEYYFNKEGNKVYLKSNKK